MGQVRLLGWFSCMICVMHIHSIRGQVGTLSANSVQPTEVLDPVSKQAVIIAQQLLTEFQLMAADFGEAERIYDRAVASGRDIFEDEDLSEGNNELDLQPRCVPCCSAPFRLLVRARATAGSPVLGLLLTAVWHCCIPLLGEVRC